MKVFVLELKQDDPTKCTAANFFFFFFKQKTAYEIVSGDWSSDVCSSDLDEPYRRALRVIHGRLTATAAEILDSQPEHELDLGLERYLTPAELLADLDVVDRSLRSYGSGVLADDRLARLREAVHVFGFHLSGLDMRQNSDVHEEVVAELLAWAGVHPDYQSLPEPDRVELLAAELATRRPLTKDDAALSELARKELDI